MEVHIMKVLESFKTKLFLILVFLMITPLIIYGIITINQERALINKQIYNDNMKLAEGLGDTVGSMITNTRITVDSIVETAGVKEMDPERIKDVLDPITAGNPYIANLYVMNRAGRQIYKTVGDLDDRSNREYMQKAIRGEANFSNVIISGSRKVPIVVYARSVRNNGRIVGVIGCSIDLEVLSELAAKYKPGKTGYGFIVENNGKIIAHPDEELVSNMLDASHLAPVKAAIEGKTGISEYSYEGDNKLAAYLPVKETGWGVVVQLTAKEAFQPVVDIVRGAVISIIITVLVGIVVAFIMGNYVTKPIIKAAGFAQAISTGNLRLAKLKVVSRDEIGKLGESLNNMLSGLKTMIAQVVNISDQVAASSQELSASGEQVGEIAEQVGTSIQDVASGAEEQSIRVEETSSNVKKLSDSIKRVDISTNELSSNAVELTDKLEQGISSVQESVSNINEMKENTLGVSKTINTLGERSREIEQIVELISGIAEQTNLLALNAAIEAARAGEAGRGFSVVADEIRELAEESAKASNEITNLVKQVQSDSLGAVEEMDNNVQLVEVSVESINNTGEIFSVIEEHTVNLKEQLKNISENVANMNEYSNNVEETTENINSVSEEFASNSEEVAASSEEQLAATEEIVSLARQLAEMAQELSRTVDQFRI
ncbi:HAMP domain-containing protein [Iocasia frigidifontis]|uniref:HAMP domain-containing protein n=2 Tax=Iocasia fonsfrigidae TaxID=2682810 RepID=A0A8A7KHA2_9FIRM|nr:HAMP domain-containing protein [Iocasia fonsfrigidae]